MTAQVSLCCLHLSGCLWLSLVVSLSGFQEPSVVLGQCPEGQLDASLGITGGYSSSLRALDGPAW